MGFKAKVGITKTKKLMVNMLETSDDYQPPYNYDYAEDADWAQRGRTGAKWEYVALGPTIEEDMDDGEDSENELAKSTPSSSPVKVRQVFPETWLWTDDTTGCCDSWIFNV